MAKFLLGMWVMFALEIIGEAKSVRGYNMDCRSFKDVDMCTVTYRNTKFKHEFERVK